MKEITEETITTFLNELEGLYRKYDLSLSHEDTHGAFIIERFDLENIAWVRAAQRTALYQNGRD